MCVLFSSFSRYRKDTGDSNVSPNIHHISNGHRVLMFHENRTPEGDLFTQTFRNITDSLFKNGQVLKI